VTTETDISALEPITPDAAATPEAPAADPAAEAEAPKAKRFDDAVRQSIIARHTEYQRETNATTTARMLEAMASGDSRSVCMARHRRCMAQPAAQQGA
jgi:hypothetical protein